MSHRMRDMLRDMLWIEGYVLLILSAAMTVPCLMAFILDEHDAARGFMIPLFVSLLLGLYIVMYQSPSPSKIKARDGYLVVSVTWILTILIGALPFYFSDTTANFTDALFESCSGFTTTGATILNNLELLPKSVLLWRSTTHWLGGMGILVFLAALLPILGISGQMIANAETPGPTEEKVTGKFQDTAREMYLIYLIMTIAEILLLRFSGLNWFDSVIHTFGTVSTGGFSNYSTNIAALGGGLTEWIIILFMFLSGMNFHLFYLTGKSGLHRLYKDDEFRFYSAVILSCTGLIFLYQAVQSGFSNLGITLRETLFQVVSVVSTTGYHTENYDLWHTFPKLILFTLFFMGASSSSAGGGLKAVRILVAMKLVRRGVSIKLHPRRVANVTLNRCEVHSDTVINIANFIFTYLLILVAGFLLISLDGFDFMSSLSAAAACLGNIGPGFNAFGPAVNYAAMSGFSRVVSIFLMLFGRLELFTVLVLFSRHFWNPNKC